MQMKSGIAESSILSYSIQWQPKSTTAPLSTMLGKQQRLKCVLKKKKKNCTISFNRVHLTKVSCLVVSDSLQPHGLQHARLPCPSPTPGAYSNSRPSCQWCHPTISSFFVPFSSCLQFFPASGSFPMSQFFASGGQNIGASASASILPINVQDRFPLGLTGFISLQSKSSQESSLTPQFKSTMLLFFFITCYSYKYFCVLLLHVTLTSIFKSYSNKSHVNHVTLQYFQTPTLLLNDF